VGEAWGGQESVLDLKPLKPGLSCRLGFLAFVALAALVTQSVSAANPPGGMSPAVRLAIPIDVDAPGVWAQAIAGAPSVGIIILNPMNGPGERAETTYTKLVGEAQAKGIVVLGYVFTQWANGNVSVQQAEKSIDQYYAGYHMDGIMLDAANNSCDSAPLQFYSALYSHVKARSVSGIVMLNPGQATGECYAAISDVLLTFENDYASYLGKYVGEDWTAKYPESHFFHIVFDVPTAAEMRVVVSLASSRGAGWLYVTNLDNSKGNPYSSLPSYFNQMLAYLGQPDDPPSPYSTTVPIIPVMLILGLTVAGSLFVVVGRRKKVAD